MRQGTKKERRCSYVNYEKIYLILLQIFADQEGITIETKIERR